MYGFKLPKRTLEDKLADACLVGSMALVVLMVLGQVTLHLGSALDIEYKMSEDLKAHYVNGTGL